MKNRILPFAGLCALFITTALQAQSKRAFAVTSQTSGTFVWNTVREIDLASGEVIRTLYDKSLQNNFEVVGAAAARPDPADARGQVKMQPMADGVAATAYDEKHDRLYYTCMRGTDLRYFDLSSPSGKVVYNQAQPLFTGNRFDEANVITRMTFAADGFGYALTNDAKNLIRFTTDQKPVITNLGELVDGKANGAISVHNLCSSWGGDMVGDAYGNLYLVSMRNHIFKINPQTRVADHLGIIKGLPDTYTTNGMAVDENGDVLLSSATVAGAYYRLNISTMEATAAKNTNGNNVYNASDLASSNLLYQNKLAPQILSTEVLGNDKVSVYPNPVSNKVLTVQFDKVPAGRYDLSLVDASGKGILNRSLVINYAGQVEKINLPRTAMGMYMIRLTGGDKKPVYNNKIVVK